MPSDPKLNEGAILEALSSENAITPNAMRSLCSLVFMCAYDRKVQREFFAELVDAVAAVEIDIAAVQVMAKVKQISEKHPDEVEPAVVKAAEEKLLARFVANRKALAHKMDLIAQCPTSTDKIS